MAKIPPELPNSVYSSIFFTPILLFISLTFEPIRTKKRFYVLLSLALLFVSIPLIYPVDSHIIPPNSENSNEKEKSLSIKSPTASQINKKLFKCFIIIIAKWLILEFTSSTYIISTKWATEIPEKVYQVRLLEFFTKRIIPITIPSFFCKRVFMTSIKYYVFVFIIAIIFRLFFIPLQKKSIQAHFNLTWSSHPYRICFFKRMDDDFYIQYKNLYLMNHGWHQVLVIFGLLVR
ncbi:hypothetical protein RhiirB3_531476 [Rhizophagus irregularis]|nr:hypothetical protein RhiirB3_531476 [Rhizophagus irregularis]